MTEHRHIMFEWESSLAIEKKTFEILRKLIGNPAQLSYLQSEEYILESP